jgi:16S rRNA (cytosine1402-N4)-methyltransferase
MAEHLPVMLREVLQYLSPPKDCLVVDGTFGAGGYSQALLEESDCRIIAIDRDPEAEARADLLARGYPGRFRFVRGCFGAMASLVASESVGAIVLDIGVSSPQLDQAERGFSFRRDGPLDMRMSAEGQSAADLVATLPEEELADILYRYGEERDSRRIAKKIVARRAESPITTTFGLRDVIHAVNHPRFGKIDPATRSFQALRIAVNDELGELERALVAAETLLKPGGRLVVVSFHSLEDRIVKQWITRQTGKTPNASRYLPERTSATARFKSLHRGAVEPTLSEIERNPRARSARLRAVERTHA